jgi:hypothetical protein
MFGKVFACPLNAFRSPSPFFVAYLTFPNHHLLPTFVKIPRRFASQNRRTLDWYCHKLLVFTNYGNKDTT